MQRCPLLKLLLALALVSSAAAWSEEKPEEDFCDAEWDGKVEYKAEGEADPLTENEDEQTEESPADEKPDDDDGEEAGSSEDEPEGSEEARGDEPEGKEDEQSGEETPDGSKDDGENDSGNTYDKSSELVRSAANVDDIQDGYLKGSMNNRLQEHIRNPIIGAASKLSNFKKIEKCFKTMKRDLKKEIDASKKEFAACKKKTNSSHQCMTKTEPGFSEHVKAIGEKIVQCMNKSK